MQISRTQPIGRFFCALKKGGCMFERLLLSFSLSRKGFFRVVIGCAIMAFTLVNIHIPAQITEGGVLGLSLFSYKVLGINPAVASPVLDLACIALGVSLLGRNFLKRTVVASVCFALFYRIALGIGAILPSLYSAPLTASVLGGLGIGIGCGLVVTQGGAAGGDDVLAFIFAKRSGISLAHAYLMMDVLVLGLSLVYIPVVRLFFSFVTTVVSSLMIGQFELRIRGANPSGAVPQGR